MVCYFGSLQLWKLLKCIKQQEQKKLFSNISEDKGEEGALAFTSMLRTCIYEIVRFNVKENMK